MASMQFFAYFNYFCKRFTLDALCLSKNISQFSDVTSS